MQSWERSYKMDENHRRPKIFTSRDKPERERKLRVSAGSWAEKAHSLHQILKFVLEDHTHFITLDLPPYASNFSKQLVSTAHSPSNIKPLHQRLYWATKMLSGYQLSDQSLVELRTERMLNDACWEQVVKFVIVGAKERTLSRREISNYLDGFGINLSVLPEDAYELAKKIIGNTIPKPVACLQGQSIPILYYPSGQNEIIFEIKFDLGMGHSFDGYKIDIVEIEVELKDSDQKINLEHIEGLFDTSEHILRTAFPGVLEQTTVSKPTPLFRHMREWQSRDIDSFEAAYEALSDSQWTESMRS